MSLAGLGRGCIWSLLIPFGATLALWVYSELDFRSNARQRASLADYIPEARCEQAQFTLVDRQQTLRDYRYVFRISGSVECVHSLRSALAKRGAVKGGIFVQDSLETLTLPDHDTPGHGMVVSFDFGAHPGSVLFIRDKT